MIIGKPYQQLREEEQAALKDLYECKTNGVKRFAWLPKTLRNGQKVWLQSYYVFYTVWLQWGRYELDRKSWSRAPEVEFFLSREEGLKIYKKKT